MKTLKNTKALIIIILMSLIMTATIVAGYTGTNTAIAITSDTNDFVIL